MRPGTTAFLVAVAILPSLAGCSAFKTMSISTGPKVEHRQLAGTRTQTLKHYNHQILRILPSDADRRKSDIDKQDAMVTQGLYLTKKGRVEPIGAKRQKRIDLVPRPGKPIRNVPAEKTRIAPVDLSVPGDGK